MAATEADEADEADGSGGADGTGVEGGLQRRQRRGWYWYDWANSAYATTVAAVFLGPYLTSVAKQAVGCSASDVSCTRTLIHVFGIDIAAGSYYSYVLAFSILVQVVVLPLTGAAADRTRRKKYLLGALAYLGSLATVSMYAVTSGRFLLGGLLYIAANMCFGASIVVYNSFLPELAEPDERDRVSARGWSLGYLGGGLLLLLNLALFQAAGGLGLSQSQAVRISLLSAGVWWAAFTVIPVSLLPGRSRRSGSLQAPTAGRPRSGFAQLRATARDARRRPVTVSFLLAYLVYNDGIQTVIALASVYGAEELRLPQSVLIGAILMVQFVAFLGSLMLAALARRIGARRTILTSLGLWTLIVVLAFFLRQGDPGQFFALAAGIGIVLGGSQALSRSLFSHVIPAGREAEYFSFYEISERGTSWLGALTFGVVYQMSGSYRYALVSVIAFFVLGAFLLARIDLRRGVAEAGNPQPALL